MSKKPKVPKPKHPDEVNGGFASEGGLEMYRLLWGLQGRVGRLEGIMVLVPVLLGVIIAKLFGAF